MSILRTVAKSILLFQILFSKPQWCKLKGQEIDVRTSVYLGKLLERHERRELFQERLARLRHRNGHLHHYILSPLPEHLSALRPQTQQLLGRCSPHSYRLFRPLSPLHRSLHLALPQRLLLPQHSRHHLHDVHPTVSRLHSASVGQNAQNRC